MGTFTIINGKQCMAVVVIMGIAIAMAVALVGFGQHVFAIFYGLFTGMAYYMLLHFQYQKGLKIGIQQAAMGVTNGLISRVCLVAALVLAGERCLNIHIIPMLAGVFITFRVVLIWQVVCIAVDSDHTK